MLNDRKKKALVMAHARALRLQTPYMRLCADISVCHPYAFNQVAECAVVSDAKGVYNIGSYADKLFPFASDHFAKNNFPYSALEVDGLKRNEFINVALWMAKPELGMVVPGCYKKVLSDVSMIQVFDGMPDWEELAENSPPEGVHVWQALAKKLGLEKPPLLRPAFQESFGPPLDLHGAYRYYGYFYLSPVAFRLYGGSPCPDWYAKKLTSGMKETMTLKDGELNFR